MNTELGSQLRVAGLVRSPDHEGALAHLDVDRGFAMVARGATSLTDVIDPTIWVKEKLSVAVAAGSDPSETPLRRLIAALRSIHGELIRRPPRDRAWVSALAALFHGGDGVLVSAGDCACFRYRDGLLSRLRRAGDESPGSLPPRGALGSEHQVRIDVVPLRPRPGDLYVASTRQLREGELAALARDLASARDGAELLRAGIEGATDRGRLAIRILEAEEDATLPARALALDRAPAIVPEIIEEAGAVEIPPLIADEAIAEEEDHDRFGAPEFLLESESVPHGVPGAVMGGDTEASVDAVAQPATHGGSPPLPQAPETSQARAEAPSAPRAPRGLATVEERPQWYEPLALWVGGALAIIALALLVRAILPGLLGDRSPSGIVAPPVAAKGLVDFFSDPPGAAVRVDGDWLEGKTPLTGVNLDTGTHRIELDWGPAGTWRDTVQVTAGERLAIHPAIYGGATFRSSDPSRPLDVYLDGTYAGTTPLSLNRVVVGRHLVRFGGPVASSTSQEIDVLRDAPADIVGNAGPVPETGRLTVRSALLTDDGFEAGKNDPVWIDGTARGATPLAIPLKPGTHSVRVVRRNFPAQVTVVDVKAGGEHYVTAEFGARSEQPIQFTPPEAISIANPLPVTIMLPEGDWDPTVAVWLYAATPDGSFQAKRMTKLEGGDRVFATVVPGEVLRNAGRRVRVYFKAATPDGRELYSEIVTIAVRP